MAITLAKNETIIKSWSYGSTKNKASTTSSELIATNKRIISYHTSKNSTVYNEIPINDIHSVSGRVSSASKRPGVIVFSIILMCTLILFLVGIIKLVKEIKRSRQAAFSVILETKNQETHPVYIGMSSYENKKKKKKNKKHQEPLVAVDRAVANQIVNELGAIVLDNRTEDTSCQFILAKK